MHTWGHSRYASNVSSGLSYSCPKAKVAKQEQSNISHYRSHFGEWSHFLEEPPKTSLGLKMPVSVFFLKLSLLRAQEQQRPALLADSWKPSIYALRPLPFPTFFFFMYNEASRDWRTSEPRYGSLGSPASIKAGKPGERVETVTGKLVGDSKRGSYWVS